VLKKQPDGGLAGFKLDWWKVARSLDMRILTEFIAISPSFWPEFAEKGVLWTHNIFNPATRMPDAHVCRVRHRVRRDTGVIFQRVGLVYGLAATSLSRPSSRLSNENPIKPDLRTTTVRVSLEQDETHPDVLADPYYTASEYRDGVIADACFWVSRCFGKACPRGASSLTRSVAQPHSKTDRTIARPSLPGPPPPPVIASR